MTNQGKEEEEEEEATSGPSEVPSRGSRGEGPELGYQRRGPRAGEGGEQQGLAWALANLGEERERGWDPGKANKQSGRDNNNKEKTHQSEE